MSNSGKTSSTRLAGVCMPICTVFDSSSGKIDTTAQEKHIDTLLESGVYIICACGGTGEFSFLTATERRELTELVAHRVDGKAKLIVHASAVMTEETIEYAKHAESVGADPLMFHGLLAGATSCFWGASNAIPQEAVALFDLVQGGSLQAASELWKRIYAVNDFIWNNSFNPAVKVLGNLLGHDLRQCRRPVQPLTSEEQSALELALSDLG